MNEDEEEALDQTLTENSEPTVLNRPIRRNKQSQLVLDEINERQGAPRTYYQSFNNSFEEAIDDEEIQKHISQSNKQNSLSSAKSFLDIRNFFEPLFKEDNPDAESISSESPSRKKTKRISFLEVYFLAPLDRKLTRAKELGTLVLQISLFTSGSAAFVIILFLFFFFLSCSTYWILWWRLMPKISHHVPLYFDFDPLDNGQQAFLCATLGHISEVELPHAHVNLLLAAYQWKLETKTDPTRLKTRIKTKINPLKLKRKLQSKKDNKMVVSKHKTNIKRRKKKILKRKGAEERNQLDLVDWRVDLSSHENQYRLLATGEFYDISLNLRLRNNEHNHNLATFMISASLISPNDKLLAYSKRPAIIEFLNIEDTSMLQDLYESLVAASYVCLKIAFLPVYLMYKVITTMASILYFESEEEFKTIRIYRNHEKIDLLELNIKLFEMVQEQQQFLSSISKVNVTLSQPCLQLWDASLFFKLKLQGLRYFLYHFRWTCFLVYCLMIVIIELNNLFFLTAFISLHVWFSPGFLYKSGRRVLGFK